MNVLPALDGDKEIPKTIYHYCQMSAFLNIVNSKTLYLSTTKCSNDSLETKWINKILKKFTAKPRSWNWYFAYEVIGLISRNKKGIYIACFSEHKDMLSQWRGYALDGNGVTLGFNTKAFSTAFNIKENKNCNLSLNKVIYNVHDQEKLILDTFNYYRNVINEAREKARNDNAVAVIESVERLLVNENVKLNHVFDGKCDYKDEENIHINKCARDLIIFSYLLKNTTFSEEAEYIVGNIA